MILRLGRLTPGYFRLLQRQMSGDVQVQAKFGAVNHIATAMAVMGVSMSIYSAKQMGQQSFQQKPL